MYIHKKIAITGGPCAGKTTAMQKIVEEFTEKGYKLFVISETATELINGGIKPFGEKACDMVEFQRYVLDLQLTKEKLYEKIANSYSGNTIILCDRGIMDNRAYVTDEDFKKILKEKNLNEMDIMSSYDLVLHLVTAADGAEKYYTTANNSARTETKEEAKEKDRKTLNSWIGHKKIEIIGNEGSFDDKIHNVIKSIYEELGEPYPIQKQYKFLVDEIELTKVKDRHLVKLEIEQFFIEDNDKQNTMIRKTKKDGDCTYSRTIKKDTDIPHERITTSRQITKQEYEEQLNENNEEQIKKSRYCFTYNKQYYRLDIFEKPKNLIILETDLTNKNNKLKIPDFITIKKDITDDIKYRNSYLYQKINNLSNDNSLKKKKTG